MIDLGLQRISRLLANTPLPWRAIHVAGTNGKGSVCAYISELLNTYNRSTWRQRRGDLLIRHGRYTSPHVVDRWDCITLSNKDSMEVVKSSLFHEIESEVLQRNRALGIGASEFELLTATAFEIFTRSKLDIAVIETGMGGRLDATNILGQPVVDEDGKQKNVEMSVFRPAPLVTAITKVGLDHQGFLGDTIEAIAKEKAGIFKPHAPVTWDNTNLDSVQDVLREAARKTSSESFFLPTPGVAGDIPDHVKSNMDVAFASASKAFAILGKTQDECSLSELEKQDLQTLQSEMATAHRRVVFPGRLEWVNISGLSERKRPVLLDGAHNGQSAEVLGQEVDKLRGSDDAQNVTWLVAASDTKDVQEILKPLLREQDNVFAVEFGPVDGMPWVNPMKSAAIISAAKDLLPSLKTTKECGSDVHAALRAAAGESGEGQLVIAGSLYLVGDVHRLLKAANAEK